MCLRILLHTEYLRGRSTAGSEAYTLGAEYGVQVTIKTEDAVICKLV